MEKAITKSTIQSLCKPSNQECYEVTKNEKSGGYEISKYNKGDITPRTLAISIKKLQTAFPSRGKEFFDLLSERIIANGFSDHKLIDAVDKAIDSFSYKEIKISDIINFDQKIRLYTYNEVCDLVQQGYKMSQDFQKREINGKVFWVKLSDL